MSLDAGLRPIEIERAVTDWVDIENAVLRIPKEQSSKNTGHWIVGLQDRTAETLDRWLEQRKTDLKYDDTDKLWLTRFGNTYGSASLRQVLRRLCDQADISYENRQMSWYSIRHSTGTYMTREEDLAAAQTQLRHKSPETAMKYDQAPVEDRQNALDRIWAENTVAERARSEFPGQYFLCDVDAILRSVVDVLVDVFRWRVCRVGTGMVPGRVSRPV